MSLLQTVSEVAGHLRGRADRWQLGGRGATWAASAPGNPPFNTAAHPWDWNLNNGQLKTLVGSVWNLSSIKQNKLSCPGREGQPSPASIWKQCVCLFECILYVLLWKQGLKRRQMQKGSLFLRFQSQSWVWTITNPLSFLSYILVKSIFQLEYLSVRVSFS